MRHNNAEANLSASLMTEVLEQTVRTAPEPNVDLQTLLHEAGDILDAIEASGEVDASRIAALEFALLPFLEHEPRGPKLLHRELLRNPDFFVQGLSLVYRAEHEEQRELTEIDASRARLAYSLLDSWRLVPGTQDDGTVSAEALHTWVQQAQEAAQAANRGRVADSMIGKVLSAAPYDADGSWPATPVREVLEQSNEVLHRGFITGVYNKRGGWIKAIAEGGGQERQLVQLYQGYAAMVRDQWPRTAALLQDIADVYSSEARRADIEVELEEDPWE